MSNESQTVEALPLIGQIAKLSLGPGDVIVLRTKSLLTDRQIAGLGDSLRHVLPHHRCVDLENGVWPT